VVPTEVEAEVDATYHSSTPTIELHAMSRGRGNNAEHLPVGMIRWSA
jgi:hypothetical protein